MRVQLAILALLGLAASASACYHGGCNSVCWTCGSPYGYPVYQPSFPIIYPGGGGSAAASASASASGGGGGGFGYPFGGGGGSAAAAAAAAAASGGGGGFGYPIGGGGSAAAAAAAAAASGGGGGFGYPFGGGGGSASAAAAAAAAAGGGAAAASAAASAAGGGGGGGYYRPYNPWGMGGLYWDVSNDAAQQVTDKKSACAVLIEQYVDEPVLAADLIRVINETFFAGNAKKLQNARHKKTNYTLDATPSTFHCCHALYGNELLKNDGIVNDDLVENSTGVHLNKTSALRTPRVVVDNKHSSKNGRRQVAPQIYVLPILPEKTTCATLTDTLFEGLQKQLKGEVAGSTTTQRSVQQRNNVKNANHNNKSNSNIRHQ